MPEDPACYIQALALHRYFETVSFTGEDAARARYYAGNVQRKELAARATDVNSFLASLQMRMKVSPVTEVNIERSTQLVNKSNQFNLTTRRYTVAQVREMAGSPDWRTLTLSLADSMGDNGLISVLFLHKQGAALAIDTWVMSCRVLLRGVEQFTRNELVAIARAAGSTCVQGAYLPTAKNGMVKDHYHKLGFELISEDGDKTFWSLDLAKDLIPLTHHIKRETSHE
jgi:FkbH-like protein